MGSGEHATGIHASANGGGDYATGIRAQGSLRGGYFEDGDLTAWAAVATRDVGIHASGLKGGRFECSSSETIAVLATEGAAGEFEGPVWVDGQLEVIGEISWSPSLASYNVVSATSEACTTPAQHTFCALTMVRQRFLESSGAYTYCRVFQNGGSWQVRASGNGITEIRCDMICF